MFLYRYCNDQSVIFFFLMVSNWELPIANYNVAIKVQWTTDSQQIAKFKTFVLGFLKMA